MSRIDYSQPPPYGASAQSNYPGPAVAPSGSSTNPRLPLYHEYHYHYHRYKPSGLPNNSAGVVAIPVRVRPVEEEHDAAANARALDRFWSALFLGFFVWFAIITLTDGMEMLRLAVIGLAGALKAILDHILRELRQAGWEV